MKTPILGSLFPNGPESKLIWYLFIEAKSTDRFRASELARLAGVPAGSIDRALKTLVARQLVVREEGRHGPEFRAPFEDPRLKHLFLLLRQDSEVIRLLRSKLRRYKSIAYACVFGSFARGQTHEQSDIDVLILGASAEEEWAIRTALQEIALKVSREISPQFVGTAEFLADIEKGEAVARSILTNPRIELIGETPWPT